MNININITEATTTFPCPINKLKGRLMDSMGMRWMTEHGECIITSESTKWIMKNVQISKYNSERCYIYNKAFARYFDNNDTYKKDKVETIAGGLMNDRLRECKNTHQPQFSERECYCINPSQFDLIRMWAKDRGLYDGGDPKTQALKLVEEVGETCRAILKEDAPEMIDGIGDCVVVLTNLAELIGTPIEKCIDRAYDEIKGRTGKMDNGTFKKD